MADRQTAKKPPPGMPAGPLQNIVGDPYWIRVRENADGVIANGATLMDTYVEDGQIYVGNSAAIAIALSIGIGSLTNATIYWQFADISKSFWCRPATYNATSQVIALSSIIYTATTTNSVIIIPNPGASWVRFYTSSTGTTTGSVMAIQVGRIQVPMQTNLVWNT